MACAAYLQSPRYRLDFLYLHHLGNPFSLVLTLVLLRFNGSNKNKKKKKGQGPSAQLENAAKTMRLLNSN